MFLILSSTHYQYNKDISRKAIKAYHALSYWDLYVVLKRLFSDIEEYERIQAFLFNDVSSFAWMSLITNMGPYCRLTLMDDCEEARISRSEECRAHYYGGTTVTDFPPLNHLFHTYGKPFSRRMSYILFALLNIQWFLKKVEDTLDSEEYGSMDSWEDGAKENFCLEECGREGIEHCCATCEEYHRYIFDCYMLESGFIEMMNKELIRLFNKKVAHNFITPAPPASYAAAEHLCLGCSDSENLVDSDER